MKKHFRPFDKSRLTILLGVLTVLICLQIPEHANADPIEIRMAAVMPEGSAWIVRLRAMCGQIKKRSNNELDIRMFAGGVAGDEADVIRKIQLGALDIGAFTGVGLGRIYPPVRIIETPLLFRDYDELDAVRETLFDEFAAQFEHRGFILLGFADGGFVYLFSRKSMTGPNGFRDHAMWLWQGDKVAESFLRHFGIPSQPLNINDVRQALRHGLIDSFYAPPLAATAFQWYTHAKYMLDCRVVFSLGAVLMAKKRFDELTPRQQEIIRSSAGESCRDLMRITRTDNEDALGIMRKAGIQFETPSPDQLASFRESARRTVEESIPRFYPRELHETVGRIITETRANRHE